MAIVQEIKVPLLAVNDTSLTVVDIPFAQGDGVTKGAVVLVLETSKTTYDVIAETNGFIGYLCVKGNDYDVNELVAVICEAKEEVPEKKAAPVTSVPANVKKEFEEAVAYWEGETLFSPAAIRLMEENNLPAEVFRGRDLVSRRDVEIKLGIAQPANRKNQGSKTMPALPVDPDKVEVEPLSSNKKREIDYLSSVQAAGLTSTIHTVVETGGIFVHLNRSLQYFKDSLLPLIIYETARLLERYRALNAYYTGDAIAYHRKVNIGFAIDIDRGLKVLKINDAPTKNIGQIEADILELSNKYLDDKLLLEDLSDISFTITDLSAEKVSFFKPLVNMMNSAILGVSSIDERLNRCILSVTFDHRVTEGKLVAGFLAELKERLQSYRYTAGDSKSNIYSDIACFKCMKLLKEDLSDVGFTKCITPKGEEAYICQTCLKGF